MAQFSVNAQRFDPYKNFKFRLKWDGRYVAGVSKMSALKRTTESVKHREGGDPSSSRKSPGRTEYEAITLERGVTHDTEFEKWANKVWNFQAGLGVEVSLAVTSWRSSTVTKGRSKPDGSLSSWPDAWSRSVLSMSRVEQRAR